MKRVARSSQVIHDFLGSTHVFSSAVQQVVERGLLRDVAGPRITPSQFHLLQLVSQTDSLTISDVAMFLGVSKAAASKAVDKLVRRKLIRRTAVRHDRRHIHLQLAEPSLRLLAAYEEQKERRLAQIFGRVPPATLVRTARLLDRLSAGLVEQSARPEEVCLKCGVYFRDRCLVRQHAKRNCFYLAHRSRRKRAARDVDGHHPAPPDVSRGH